MVTKTIIELQESLSQEEQEKLIHFLEYELCIDKTKIFNKENYVQESDFAHYVYERTVQTLKEDFKVY